MTLRKNFENDFKNMDLTWGMAERDKQKRNSWRKSLAVLSSMDRRKKKEKLSVNEIHDIRHRTTYVFLDLNLDILCFLHEA